MTKRNSVLRALIISCLFASTAAVLPVQADDVANQTASVSTGSTPNFGGQATGADNAVSNQLDVSGTANVGNAYGGLADQGKATGNTLNISGGTVGAGYAGFSNSNDVTGNTANMTGGSVTSMLYGGYTAKGAAGAENAGNAVNITNIPDGGLAKDTWIYGGRTGNGNADYNTISITGTTSTATSSSSSEAGAINLFAGFSKSGGASHNTVTIQDSTLASVDARGAYSDGGEEELNYNTVKVINSKIDLDSSSHVVVTGAMTFGTGAMNHNSVVIDNSNTGSKTIRVVDRSYDVVGTADYNSVEVKNGSVVNGEIEGAYQRYGSASHNTVSVSDSTVTGCILGTWIRVKGNVENNKVTIANSTVSDSVLGSVTIDGYAAGNSVLLDGTTSATGTVYGAQSVAYSDGTVGVAGNSVTVTGTSSAAVVYGGYAGRTSAAGNSVTYDSTAKGKTGIKVYGGYAVTGNAGQEDSVILGENTYEGGNTVRVTGSGTFASVTGGYSRNGNAVNNEVTIGGANGAVVQAAYGGSAAKGTVSDNTLNIEDGSVTNGYGGWSNAGDVTGNKVNMTGGSATGMLYGGYTAKGAAGTEGAGNTVTISGISENSLGTLISGGSSSSGSASGNTVSITNANETDTDKLIIYGGSASGGDASNNTVRIENKDSGSARLNLNNVNILGALNNSGTGDVNDNTVEVTGYTLNETGQNSVVVMGAQNLGTGTLNDNKVTLDNTTVQYSNANGTFWGLVRAADRSSDIEGVANNNTITIKNGSEVGKVDGAYERNGTASGNKAIVNGSTVHGMVAAAEIAQTTTHGYVTNNGTTITNSTVTGNVYGGETNRGYAAGNEVTVDGTSEVQANVYGGRSFLNDIDQIGAAGNTVTIKDKATVETAVYGGWAGGGTNVNGAIINSTSSAYGNSVEYSSTADNQTDIKIYGGYAVNGDAGQEASGTIGGVEYKGSNTVNVTGSGTYEMIAGGYSEKGNAASNGTTIDGTKGAVILAAYGGYTESGTASKNTMNVENVNDSQAGLMDTGTIAGGYSDIGNAENNTVTLTNNTSVTDSVYGGKSGKGNVTGNTVTMTETKLVGARALANAYGGYTAAGTASGNKVYVNNDSYAGSAYGGYTESGDAVSNEAYASDTTLPNLVGGHVNGAGNASSNKAIMKNSIVSGIAGGETNVGDATGNTVTMTDSKATTVYGGSTNAGNASGNIVTMTGGGSNEVLSVAGGVSLASGNATDNEVTITNLTADTAFLSGMPALVGGAAMGGEATGNTLTITQNNGTLSMAKYSAGVYGGYGSTGASDNKLSVSGDDFTAYNLYGGYTDTGDAVSNSVSVKDSTVAGNVYVGYSNSGTATQNSMTISSGTLQKNAYGGYSQSGTATANTMTLADGGNVTGSVYGGYSPTGTASENTVTVTGGTADTAIGGTTDSGTATGNIVTLSGGTVSSVYGGTAAAGTASSNIVNVNDGGTITTTVAGGASDTGDVTGNVLNINGGTVGTTESTDENGNLIIGGLSQSGNVTDNTINVYGGTLGSMMSLYGGLVTSTGSSGSGNTLNMYNKANTVKNLGNFQTMNFYVPKGTTPGETMITVTGTADVSNTAIYGAVDDSTKMSKGQVINLIVDNGGITSNGTEYKMIPGKDEVTDAGFVSQKVINKKIDANHIVLMIPDDDVAKIEDDTKAFPENRANATGTLIGASDLAVTDGFTSAVAAYQAAWLEDHSIANKFTPYIVLGGHNLRYTTGSYVDTNGFNGELGFVKRNFHTSHIDTIMPFLEYGNGNYTGHQDSGARSDGNQRYVGAGILLRRDFNSGIHYEGMFRAGRINGDYAGLIDEHHASYKDSSPYMAAHLGIGKLVKHADNDFDYYARFFWTHLGADHTIVTSDLGQAPYSFDAVNSYRTRLGMRWTKHLHNDATAVYAGLGWDYEFDGEARAMYKSFSTPAPSLQGSSGFLELGWQSKVTKDNPWGADVRVTGWAGMQRGVTYSATISRAF